MKVRKLTGSAAMLLFCTAQPGMVMAQDTNATTGSGSPAPADQTLAEGTHIIDASSLSNVMNLTVDHGATAVIDFGHRSDFSVLGNLVNNGTIYAASSNPAISAVSISAGSIFNNPGALLSTMLPTGGIAGFTSAGNALSLSLTAVHDIVNAGTISSAANLSMTAGSSIVNQATIAAVSNINLTSLVGNIVNSGNIASAAGNINMAAATAQNLAINNTGGTIEALLGSINVRDAAYAGTANIDLTGGNWLSRELNLNAGQGEVRALLDDVTGTVNTSGTYAQIGASTPLLTLGNTSINGDPTFFNDLGDISITGDVIVNEALAILARGNISTTAAVNEIRARTAGGQGLGIQILAGLTVVGSTGSPSTTTVPGTQATLNTTAAWFVSGPAGNIDFTASPNVQINANSTCSNCAGATVRLAAGASGDVALGKVLLPVGSQINVSGNGTGANGNVVIVAGHNNSLTAVTTGQIIASGGQPGTGNVTIAVAQPTTTFGAASMTWDAAGNQVAGGGTTPSSTITNGSISLLNNVTAGNSITVSAGLDITAPERVTGTIPVTTSFGTTINSAGTFVYATDFGSNTVAVIDTSTNTVVTTIPVGSRPQGVAVNGSGTRVYTANSNTFNASVIDTATNTVVASPNLGFATGSVSLNPAETRAYFSAPVNDRLIVLDTTTNTVITAINVNSPGIAAVSPSGETVYVTNSTNGTVSVLNASSNTISTTITVGTDPRGIAVNPNGSTAFVANNGSDTVSVIDTTTNQVTTTIAVSSPESISFNPAGTLAYVTKKTGGTDIIDTISNTVVRSVNASPSINQFDKPTNFVGFVGNNLTGYVPSPNANITVFTTPALVASNVSLTSTSGNISVVTNANQLTTSSSSATARANITEVDNVSIGATNVTGSLLVGSKGNISTAATISAGSLTLQSMGLNSTLSISNSVTATTNMFLYSNGNMNLTGALTAPDITLKTVGLTGSINVGSPVTATNSAVLSATGSGSINSTASITATIAVGSFPRSAAAGQLRTYIGNATANTVSVIDNATNTVIATIPVGNNPSALALNENTGRTYVANRNSGTVSVIDTNTNTVIATVPVGSNPTGVAVNPTTGIIYVANEASNDVSVIDPALNTVVVTVAVGSAPQRVAVSGGAVYVTNFTSNTVSVIDAATNTVSTTIPIGAGTGALGITANPAGNFVYVGDRNNNRISIIDTSSNTVVGTFAALGSPSGLSVNPAGTQLYVTDEFFDNVSIVDTATNSFVSTTPVGTSPFARGQFATFTSNAAVAYVPNTGNNNVSVLATPAIESPVIDFRASTGNIFVVAKTGNFNATTGGTGNINITNLTGLTMGTSSAGGSFMLGAPGAITTTSTVSGANVTLQAVGSNSALSVGGNITASNNVALYATGALGTTASVTAANVVMRTIANNSSITIGQGTSLSNINASGSINISANGTGSIVLPQTVAATINIASAFGAAINPAGNKVYVTGNATDTVSVVNPATNTVTGTINTGAASQPRSVIFSPDGSRAYVALSLTNAIQVIDTATDTAITTVPLGAGSTPTGLAISPDGTRVYVSNPGSNTVAVINTATNTLITSVAVGTAPTGITIDPSGARVYVANRTSNTVSVINTDNNTVVNTLALTGTMPGAILADPSGRFVYTANSASNNVSVIDTFSLTETQVIAVPSGATGLGVDPTGGVLFVTSFNNNNVTSIKILTNSVIATTPLGNGPQAVTNSFGKVGNNIVGYIPNGLSSTVSVFGFGTLNAPTVNLRSGTGNITAPVNATTVTATSGTGSEVLLMGLGASTNLGTSSGGNFFQFGSVGSIATTGTLVASNIFLQTTAGGSALTLNTALSTTGTMRLLAHGALSLNSSVTTNAGGLLVRAGSGALNVGPGISLIANGGTTFIQNWDRAAGTIVFGAGSTVTNRTVGAGVIQTFLGPAPSLVNTTAPANVTVNTSGGAQVTFGTNSIAAIAPTNTVNAGGATARVAFDTAGRPAAAITLGGGVTFNAASFAGLTSLDLTDAATVAGLKAQQTAGQLGGFLVVVGGVAVGGTLILNPLDVGQLSAKNIPANVLVTYNGFQAGTPVNINITGASTTPQVVINGLEFFTGTGTTPVFNITSNQNPTVLNVGQTALLYSTGGLTITGNGSMQINAPVITGGALNLTTTNGGAITTGTTGSLIVSNGAATLTAAGAVTIGGVISQFATGANPLAITAGGNLNINQVVFGNGVNLQTTPASNGAININSSVLSLQGLSATAGGTGALISSNLGVMQALGGPTSLTGSGITLGSLVSSPVGTLTVTSAGAINLNSTAIGNGVVLQTTPASNGAININGLLLSYQGLTATTGGNGAFNSTTPGILQAVNGNLVVTATGITLGAGAYSSLGTATLTSAGALTIDGGLIGKGVTLTTTAGSNGSISARNFVISYQGLTATAGGTGSFTSTNIGVMQALSGALNLTSGGNMAINASTFSSLGTTMSTSGGNLTIGALVNGQTVTVNNTANGGAVNINGPLLGLQGITVGSTGTGGTLQTGAAVQLIASQGSVSLTSNTGNLSIGANNYIAALAGSITLRNADDTGPGSINIGTNSFLFAFSTVPAAGQVNIGLGTLPFAQANGLNPGSVNIVKVGTGDVFFGANSITTQGPLNNLIAINQKIVFSTSGQLASQIKLNGGVTIIADPPSSGTHLVTPASSLLTPVHNEAAPSAIPAAAASPVSSMSGTPIFMNIENLTVAGNVTAAQASRQTGAPAFTSNDIVIFDGSSFSTQIEKTSQSVPSEFTPIASISKVGPNRASDARVVTEHTESGELKLVHGGVFFKPAKDLRLQSKWGTLKIGAGAAVLVIATPDGVSVFNFHDLHRGDVAAVVDGQTIEVSIGRHLTLADNGNTTLGDLNPLSFIGHREVVSKGVGNELRSFTSEFSMVSALTGLKVMSLMKASASNADKKLYRQLVKNAAVLMHTSKGRAAYRSIPVSGPRQLARL